VIPFIDTSRFISENPFYNRNVIDPAFSKLTFFIKDSVVSGFGVVHLTLAFIMLGIIFQQSGKWSRNFFFRFVGILVLGLALFEVGININLSSLTKISQSVVVVIFIILIVSLILLKKRIRDYNYSFVSLWFLIFLWFGLGGYMVPFTSNLPPPFLDLPFISFIWSRLDVHRFWLYLTIPASILAAPIILRILKESKNRKMYRYIAIVFILVLIIGGAFKATWSLTHPINEYLPQDYTTVNQEIPPRLINYLSSDPWNGRILAIHCPFWIYLLPIYLEDKTLVDGWYPQGKIIEPLYRINDYRLNDLEATANNTERLTIWSNLIENSDTFGINWVIIGGANESLKSSLIQPHRFRKVYSEPYGEGEITIYRSLVKRELIVWPSNQKTQIFYQRETPDKIKLKLKGNLEEINITVKEAYFPTWKAQSNGVRLEVYRDEWNFISLLFSSESDEESIELYHSYDFTIPIYLTFGSLIVVIFTLALSWKDKFRTIK